LIKYFSRLFSDVKKYFTFYFNGWYILLLIIIKYVLNV
jgi:hypothetical protein